MSSTSAVDVEYFHRWQVSWAKTNPLALFNFHSCQLLFEQFLVSLAIHPLMSSLSTAKELCEVSESLAALENCAVQNVIQSFQFFGRALIPFSITTLPSSRWKSLFFHASSIVYQNLSITVRYDLSGVIMS